PVDAAVRAAAPQKAGNGPKLQVRNFTPFDPATKVAEAVVADEAGIERRVIKGAPVAVGRLAPFDARVDHEIEILSRSAGRVIAVAFGPARAEKLVGLIALSDPPRPESKPLIAELRAEGVKAVMVTGDAAATAAAVGRAVGLTGPVCPAAKIPEDANPDDFAIYAGVFPEDKFKLVQAFQRRGRVVGMCGDGANDAPALRQAQMGVAVSTATDVAKSAASIVLTEPGLKGVVAAIEEGRAAFQRILTYTLNALVKKFQLVPFLGVGLLVTGHAIVTPMQMALLLITGDFLTMAIATDRATPSSRPDAWRIGAMTGAAVSLAFAGLLFLSAIILVGERMFRLDIGALRTLAFLSLVFLGQATVYVLRERRRLWSSPPSKWLAASSLMNVAMAVLLALSGWLMTPLPAWMVGELLLATLLFSLLLDLLKTFVFAQFGLTAGAKIPVEAAPEREPSPWVLPAAAALVAIVAAAVGLWPSTVNPPPHFEEGAPRASGARFATFEGKIVPVREQFVVAQNGGTIGALDCELGERVEAARLCATIFHKPYQRLREGLESLEHNLARDERLLSSQASVRGGRHLRSAAPRHRLLTRTRKERSDIHKLRVALAEQEKDARRIEIRAPFDAIVVARYVSAGQKVSAFTPLFQFAKQSPDVKAELDVPHEQLPLLRIGAAAEITSEAVPRRILKGRIVEIHSPADGEGASGRIVVEAPRSDGGFAVDSSVTAKIEIRRENERAETTAPPSPLSKARAPK
ncbi:MAG: HAD-IC family P-type ATPase, partial [Methylocystis sp.]